MPRLNNSSWESIEDLLGIEPAGNRWTGAFVVKFPGTLKDCLANLRRRLGKESSAQAIALSILFTLYALEAAETGRGIRMTGHNGPQMALTNEQLRELFGLPRITSSKPVIMEWLVRSQTGET